MRDPFPPYRGPRQTAPQPRYRSRDPRHEAWTRQARSPSCKYSRGHKFLTPFDAVGYCRQSLFNFRSESCPNLGPGSKYRVRNHTGGAMALGCLSVPQPHLPLQPPPRQAPRGRATQRRSLRGCAWDMNLYGFLGAAITKRLFRPAASCLRDVLAAFRVRKPCKAHLVNCAISRPPARARSCGAEARMARAVARGVGAARSSARPCNLQRADPPLHASFPYTILWSPSSIKSILCRL